jgi:AraC-like DNA-binding protein
MSQARYPAFNTLSTVGIRASEQFDKWISLSGLCDFALQDDAGGKFDARYESASLGSFSVGGPTWLNPDRRAIYDAHRSASRIRKDGADFYQFIFRFDSTTALRSPSHSCVIRPGELYMIDMAQPVDARLMTGNAVSLVAQRDMLPPETERLHGHVLANGVAQLFSDYLRSLVDNLPDLAASELPLVVEATTRILTASVQPHADVLQQAEPDIRNLLRRRVQRYIDAHLLHPGLTPDQICKDVGVSRSKLYQLFEATGGVMREIRRQRLALAHQKLVASPRSTVRIAEVAWDHGFVDEKYFSRVFKAEFGYSPGEAFERMQRR